MMLRIKPGVSLSQEIMKGFETVKKKLVSLILALAMMFSMVCFANAAELRTVRVTGNQNYTYAFQVLELVNQERTKEGLKPLTMDTSLLDTAMLRAAECSVEFSHTRPDGTSCYTANELMYGENIASGYTTPASVMTGWMNSEGHRANILTEAYTTIGIGCVEVDGILYWVQNFGYSGSTQADPSSYSDSSNTWTINVSSEAVNEGYFLQKGSITYLVAEDQAAVYLCDEAVSGAISIDASVDGRPVTVIDYAAFADCTEITSVSIPDSVIAIGYDAFHGCTKLATVNIPSSVVFIGADAFYDSRCFRNAYSDGIVYLDNWLLYVDPDLTGSFTVQDGTVGVAEMAALDCEGITSLTIPASVQYINNQAFAYCSDLDSITFQGSAPVIEEDSFNGVAAAVNYPEGDSTWNSDTMQNYGGDLTWPVPRFVDLPEDAWYTVYANRAADLGLMNGVGNNRFDPMGTTNRAMFVQILYAMEGKPTVGIGNPFTDVPDSQWYADAVQWAYEESVTEGTSATTFSPNANVTREQIAVFLYAYYGRPEVTGDLSGFTDAEKVDIWAVNAVLWATQNGIISGVRNSDGSLSLNPLGQATRAETATMMVGFYDLVNS